MRVAVLGASGFGRFHAREFQRAGADLTAILGSTEASAATTAARLEADYGCAPTPFHRLADLLATKPDVVSVCTPDALHFEHVSAALAGGAFVLCEKPLLWSPGLTRGPCDEQLQQLESLGAVERLGLNALNVLFLDELQRRQLLPEHPATFTFQFHTQGPFEHESIAVDLLTHALSFLQRLVPSGEPRDIERVCERSRVTFEFRWAGIDCCIELREDPRGAKHLGWSIDDRTFERTSGETAGGYRVALQELGVDASYPLADPLQTLIETFVRFARGQGQPTVDYHAAAAIQRAMTKLLGEY